MVKYLKDNFYLHIFFKPDERLKSMSVTLKKLEDIQKRKLALQQEEDNLRSEFVTELTEILSSLPLFTVDLDVLIGAIATAIDHARYDNPSNTNNPQVTIWKERGIVELNRFRRHKKNNKQEQSTSKITAKKSKTSPQINPNPEKNSTENQ